MDTCSVYAFSQEVEQSLCYSSEIGLEYKSKNNLR